LKEDDIMKSFKLILCLLLSLSSAAFGKNPKNESVLARITVYWASGGAGSDRDTRNHRCATGARLRNGHCAVDPHRIPFGSRILLPTGETLAAVDTGTAVRNRKAARLSGRNLLERSALVIDRFFETKGQAMAWANAHPPFMAVKVSAPVAQNSTEKATPAPLRRNRAAMGRPT
jgi:3D (Asp-Asp-Asp) domain-containing protein